VPTDFLKERALMLPDLLRPGLRLIICGTAVATASLKRGHYYAGPGNEFWALLEESGLVPVRLMSEQDSELLAHGIGLTDLVKDLSQSHDRGLQGRYDVGGFRAKVAGNQPAWVALHGKEAGKAVARSLGQPPPGLGPTSWQVEGAKAFVLPSASGANRGGPYDGRSTRLNWWRELADLIKSR
jgi:TDG/mug DNA glycosylase family protein